MKRQFFLMCLAVAGIAAVMLTGCKSASAGTGQGSGSAAPAQSRVIERVILDYQGAAIGADIPAWLNAVVDGDREQLRRMPRFQGQEVFVFSDEGQNLDLLRSWVNNFNIQAEVSRRISNYVEAAFGGEQLGNKNTAENINFIKEVVASLSSVQFSGLAREMDYWIKLRTIDNSKKTEKEGYYYYVVYTMPATDLQYQIDRAMGRISAKTQEQQEIKSDVEDAMRQTRFNSIEQPN